MDKSFGVDTLQRADKSTDSPLFQPIGHYSPNWLLARIDFPIEHPQELQHDPHKLLSCGASRMDTQGFTASPHDESADNSQSNKSLLSQPLKLYGASIRSLQRWWSQNSIDVWVLVFVFSLADNAVCDRALIRICLYVLGLHWYRRG